jgi:hypothetical protein
VFYLNRGSDVEQAFREYDRALLPQQFDFQALDDRVESERE